MPFDGADFIPGQCLVKLDAVIELLGDPDKWCKGRLRTSDGRYCLRGAILEARGVGLLEQPILQAIIDVTGCHSRRIESFNDDIHTDHELICTVLAHARDNLIAGRVTRSPRQRIYLFGTEGSWTVIGWYDALKKWFRRSAH